MTDNRVTMEPVDRTDWRAGPWDEEGDRDEWRDPGTGMPCCAKRGPVGSWCGYVGVSPGHPLHGVDYDDPEAGHLDVHGGLTFAGPCQPDNICHSPAPGESEDVWWFGFDCAHFGDRMPGLAAVDAQLARRYSGERLLMAEHGAYRDLAFVRAECGLLAEQLVGGEPARA